MFDDRALAVPLRCTMQLLRLKEVAGAQRLHALSAAGAFPLGLKEEVEVPRWRRGDRPWQGTKPWENHGKMAVEWDLMGKSIWKTIGKLWFNGILWDVPSGIVIINQYEIT